MGFSNGFIASIILKDKPLREFNYNGKRTVKIPFGSEYIIRLKNKSKEPALVDVSIDGTDVLNGSQLVLKDGETIDLERFVDDNSKGKKFKFISLEEGASTGKIDDPYREENGLIQVKFHKAFYLPKLNFTIKSTPDYTPFCGAVINHDYLLRSNPTFGSAKVGDISTKSIPSSDNILRGCSLDTGKTTVNSCFYSSQVAGASSYTSNDLPQDKGATVEGSVSNQSFSSTNDYIKLGGPPTVVDIYVAGPNYTEKEVTCEWGVFVGTNKEPIAKFKEKKHAHLFAGNSDFGKESVTVKETN